MNNDTQLFTDDWWLSADGSVQYRNTLWRTKDTGLGRVSGLEGLRECVETNFISEKVTAKERGWYRNA